MKLLWIAARLLFLIGLTFVTSIFMYSFIYWIMIPKMTYTSSLNFDYGERTSKKTNEPLQREVVEKEAKLIFFQIL